MKGQAFSIFRMTVLVVTSALVFSTKTQAGPEGGVIVGGSGTIQQHNLTTTIHQNSSSLAIDWNSFNISKDESVNFLQPGSTSIALNRILDLSASQIHGQINANGQVVRVLGVKSCLLLISLYSLSSWLDPYA